MMIFFKYSLGKQTTRARQRINQTNMDFLKSLICYDFMVQTAWKIVKVCWPIPYFITFRLQVHIYESDNVYLTTLAHAVSTRQRPLYRTRETQTAQ